MSDIEIRKIIEIDAPVHVVFKALTDSDDLTQWFPDNGTFEARVGGKMHFTFLAGRHNMDKDHHLNVKSWSLSQTRSWSIRSYRMITTDQTALVLCQQE